MAHSTHPRSRAPFAAFAVLGLALLSSGCYAEATTGAVVSADYVPAHVEAYPREYYDGRTVYLIGDRWYYHDGGHWVYYRSEPEVLVRRRVVIHQAPPVVRERTLVHQAPPARHEHYRYQADPTRRHAERRVAPPAQ
jgi:hypothetical protein